MPPALGNLVALRSLSLLGNALSGPVPRELGELSSLGSLDLSSNALIGHLPSELSGGMGRVEWFSWENNDGLCVPNTGSFNTWLETMRAWHGPRCGLPEERDALVVFYGAAGGSEWENNKNWLTDKPLEDWHGVYAGEDGNVADINLRRNNLVGTIPAELGELTSLLSLNVYGNQLAGSVSAELGKTALTSLYLARNHLTGEMPAEILSLPDLQFLGWRNNAGLCVPQTEESRIQLARLGTWDGALCGEAEPGFQIQLVFDEAVPDVLRDAMNAAAAYWMEALAETELLDFGHEGGPNRICGRDYRSIRIDDVMVSVWVEDTGSAVATGGPCATRGTPEMPLNGVVKFNPAWIDRLVDNDALGGGGATRNRARPRDRDDVGEQTTLGKQDDRNCGWRHPLPGPAGRHRLQSGRG